VDNRQASQITTGIIVIVVGLLLLAGQLNTGWHFGRLWPLILIVIGGGRFLSTSPDGRRSNSGVWLLFIGGIFLLNNFRVLTLHYSWPLFVVMGGFMLIFGRRDGWDRRRGMRDGDVNR
jgi:hypothetical protein